MNVDAGETSAMALYLEQTEDALLVIDELKGRLVAQELGIKFLGTLGILIKARQTGLISNIQEVIDHLEETDFRLTTVLRKQLLET